MFLYDCGIKRRDFVQKVLHAIKHESEQNKEVQNKEVQNKEVQKIFSRKMVSYDH